MKSSLKTVVPFSDAAEDLAHHDARNDVSSAIADASSSVVRKSEKVKKRSDDWPPKPNDRWNWPDYVYPTYWSPITRKWTWSFIAPPSLRNPKDREPFDPPSAVLGDRDVAFARMREVILPAIRSWKTHGRSDLVPGTHPRIGHVSWLFDNLYEETFFKELSDKYQKTIRWVADSVCQYELQDGRRFGDIDVRKLGTSCFKRLYDKMRIVSDGIDPETGEESFKERRSFANLMLRVCAHAWSFGHQNYDHIVGSFNPPEHVKQLSVKHPKEVRVATWGELETFVQAADDLGYPSLGTLALLMWEFLMRKENAILHFTIDSYKPTSHPDAAHINHHKTGEEVWISLFDEREDRLYQELEPRLDALKAGRSEGLMFLRDKPNKRTGVCEPWITESGDQSYLNRIVKKIVKHADLDPDIRMQSFRHGGFTELGAAKVNDARIRTVSRHLTSSHRVYMHSTMEQIADVQVDRVGHRKKVKKGKVAVA